MTKKNKPADVTLEKVVVKTPTELADGIIANDPAVMNNPVELVADEPAISALPGHLAVMGGGTTARVGDLVTMDLGAGPGPDPLLALWAETELPDLPTSQQQIVDATLQLLDSKRERIRSLERQLDTMAANHRIATAGEKTIRDILGRVDGTRPARTRNGEVYTPEVSVLELTVLKDLADTLKAMTA